MRGRSFGAINARLLMIPEPLQSKSKEGDYKSVREAIVSKLETDDYDDGATQLFLEFRNGFFARQSPDASFN